MVATIETRTEKQRYPSAGSARGSRWLAGSTLGVVLSVAAACGSGGASSPTSTKAGNSQTIGHSAPVTVGTSTSATLGTILIDQSGKALYRYAPDGIGKSTCTGSCAVVWPPLTAPAGTTHLSGKGGVSASDLGTLTRPGGALQITFKGMPLYRFSGDAKPGDTKGQGVEGAWFVVSTAASSPPPSSPTPSQPSVTVGPPTSAPQANVSSPPPTAPPATAPPATSPPATAPPATSPPATSPPATSPPPTAPPTTQSGGYGY